jgi:hypothetical protein
VALKQRKQTLIQSHHIGGEDNDADLTEDRCLNCHKRVTELQSQCGVDLCRHPKNLLERHRNMLKGQAASRIDEAKSLLDRESKIEKLERALDKKFPDWRKLPEAE